MSKMLRLIPLWCAAAALTQLWNGFEIATAHQSQKQRISIISSCSEMVQLEEEKRKQCRTEPEKQLRTHSWTKHAATSAAYWYAETGLLVAIIIMN